MIWSVRTVEFVWKKLKAASVLHLSEEMTVLNVTVHLMETVTYRLESAHVSQVRNTQKMLRYFS